MYTSMLAASYWFHPATSTATGKKRVYMAVFFTALGAIVGWPFAAALGIPIIFEQLLCSGGEIVEPAARSSWRVRRMNTLVKAILASACLAVSHLHGRFGGALGQQDDSAAKCGATRHVPAISSEH